MFAFCNLKKQKELYDTTKQNFTANVKIETPNIIDGEEYAALKAKPDVLELIDQRNLKIERIKESSNRKS